MGCPPSGLDHHIDINPNGTLEQLVTGLTVGDSYTLSFYTSVHYLLATGCGTTGGAATATVSLGTMFSTMLSLNAADAAWTKRVYHFIATAPSEMLRFQGISSCYGNGGVLFDDVWLTADTTSCDGKGRFADAGRDTAFCADDKGEALIHLNASGGVSYSWSPAAAFTDPSLASVSTIINKDSRFIVTVTDADGCTDKDTIDVRLDPLPVVTVPGPLYKCAGAEVPLRASGAIHYSWSPPAGLSRTDVSDPVLTVSSSVTQYVVRGVDANGCAGSDTLDVYLLPGLIVEAWPEDTSACPGTRLNLKVSGADHYRWFPPAGLSDDTSAEPWLLVSGSMEYVVTGTNDSGCTGTDTVRITAYPSPDLKATVEGSLGCSAEPVWVHATGANTYSWQPAVYCDEPGKADTKVKPPHTLVFTVTGVNTQGCTGTDTVTVWYEGASVVHVPNAFTPNGDGLNDKIRPLVFCDFVLTAFRIYNRWGEEVFRTEDIHYGWDGTFKGVPLSGGVFYYLLQGKDHNEQHVVLKGDITLIR